MVHFALQSGWWKSRLWLRIGIPILESGRLSSDKKRCSMLRSFTGRVDVFILSRMDEAWRTHLGMVHAAVNFRTHLRLH